MPRLCDKSHRVPRNRKRAIHWIDQSGTVSCRTQLDAEAYADGRCVSDVEAVNCAACLRIIEIQYEPDFLGNKKPPMPACRDWGPLFKKTVGLLLVLLAVACQQPDPLRSVMAMKPTPASEFLVPSVGERALGALLEVDAPAVRGVMRMIPTPTQCRMQGGVLPYVYPDWVEPRAGQPLRIQWVTRALDPEPDEPAVLMVSDRPRADGPLSTEPWGHYGCWLAVNPDVVLSPADTGMLVRRDGAGTITLNWTPDAWLTGKTFYVQLLIGTLDTESRLAVSPGFEVTIGSAL